jgi:hypothetical protein
MALLTDPFPSPIQPASPCGSVVYASELVPCPIASHIDPFHTTSFIDPVIRVVILLIGAAVFHVIPSYEYAIYVAVAAALDPTASIICPFVCILQTRGMSEAVPAAVVQLIPSYE